MTVVIPDPDAYWRSNVPIAGADLPEGARISDTPNSRLADPSRALAVLESSPAALRQNYSCSRWAKFMYHFNENYYSIRIKFVILGYNEENTISIYF